MSEDNRSSPPDQRTLWTDEEWLRAVARAPVVEPGGADHEEQARRRLGTVLKSRYRLDRILGAGGMATVYAATHRNGYEVAIKILHSFLSANEDIRGRFLREGYVANTVGHKGVVRVLDDDVAGDGCAFLVMELLDGESLQSRLRRLGRLEVRDVLTIAKDLLDVLIEAHAKGIVHRDLKPDNLFMTREGHLKVLDFGVARALFGPSALTTETGRVLGTPAFMAPEQARAQAAEIDAQTDLWAAGATMFTLLSGRYVHEAPTSDEVARLAAKTHARPVSSVVSDLPSSVTALVDNALQFSKSDRWQSAAAMRAEIVEAMRSLFGTDDVRSQREAIALAPTVAAEDAILKQPVDSTNPVALADRVPPFLRRPRSRVRLGVIAGATAVIAGLAAYALVNATALARWVGAWNAPRAAVPEMSMVRLSGGSAKVGRSPEVRQAECDLLGEYCRPDVVEREQPEHEVTLSPFMLDVREVTNNEFVRWLRMIPTQENYLVIRNPTTQRLIIDLSSAACQIGFNNGSFFAKEGHEREPVVEISWDGARMYCESRNKRLPTEAEWEFAARGNPQANRRFPWGNELPRCEGVAYARGTDPKGNPLPCGFGRGPEDVLTSSQDVTPEGVHDLGGNVSEWVQDAYLGPYPDCGSCINPVANAAGDPKTDERVFRGASYSTFAFLPSSSRGHWDRNDTSGSIGFRCAADFK